MVPTVDLMCLSAAPKQGNNSDLIYCWYAGAMGLYAFLRLFFKSNPAACRISTDLPCPKVTQIQSSISTQKLKTGYAMLTNSQKQ